ncbi:MAG TPA: hypothetical protein VHW26_00365 [Solirubrobacteraceae bacterium]|nr:hypothetical protein [Solirubrobacteraceae bacterium]
MTLAGHAEVLKLARLLGTSTERLGYLERLSPEEIREVRERASDVLFDLDGRRFRLIALASKLPPAAVTAVIAEHAFGPLLCARITAQLEVKRAVDLAERLPRKFVAALAINLDPRRARDIVAAIPPYLIAEVAAELTRDKEYVAMGRFVGYLTDAAVKAAFRVIDDGSLLRISYFVEVDEHLDHVVGLLEEVRIRGAIRAATDEDLWPQALDLLSRVAPERAGRLADLAAEEDDRVLEGMVETAQRDGLWDVVLPVTNEMSEAGLARFTSLPALHRPDVLRAMVHVAIVSHVEVLPLVALLPPHARVIVWAEIVSLGEMAPTEVVNLVVEQALETGIEGVIEEFVGAIIDGNLLATSIGISSRLAGPLQTRLAVLAAGLSPGMRLRVVAHARHLGVLDQLGPLRQALTGG